MLDPEFIAKMKQKLLEAKAQLEKDLLGVSKHTEIGSDIDAQVQEIEGDQVNRDIMVTVQADLEKINKALLKIEAGTYGVDEEGNQISKERLEALPWADKAI